MRCNFCCKPIGHCVSAQALCQLLHNRRLQLEKQLQSQQLTDEERQNILQALERRERDFTRLQRQRMSAADFELLTIIGRGAFGEVRHIFHSCLKHLQHMQAISCFAAGETVQAEN